MREPSGGGLLLLTEEDPDRGLSQCNSALVPLGEAGPLLSHLMPNPAWTACRKDADCTASEGPGCLPPLPVRRDALRPVKAWRREVAEALHFGEAPAAAAGAPAPRPACQAGTCGFAATPAP
ncbi:MAG: hypothetical protein FJ086_01520 [Deltaproteobacteria bacterium]|nr:hypothetical protein [Deltaproteobacteria bacterium]